MTKKTSKARIILFSIVVILLVIVGVFGYQIYHRAFNYPTDSPSGEYLLVVESGDTAEVIAKKFEQDKVVYSADLFLIREGLQPINELQVGEYALQVPARTTELIKQINAQAQAIKQANLEAGTQQGVSITLREGLTLDSYANILSEEGIVDKQSFLNYAKDPDNFDREKYEFLPEPLGCEYGDITKCAKYYPEGYLYPDTYQFFESSEPETVFNKMLSNFNTKVWSRLKSQATDKDFDKVVVLASVLEKETGRTKGIKEGQLEEVNAERQTMAQVFYNRLDNDMKWQSDVTIEYGTGRKVCQQTFEIENCFFLDSPIAQHKYNTYLNKGFPVGPVTNPQYYNVEAALNPTPNNYLFFVSDATGKKYFAETSGQHQQIIEQVNEINRELGL